MCRPPPHSASGAWQSQVCTPSEAGTCALRPCKKILFFQACLPWCLCVTMPVRVQAHSFEERWRRWASTPTSSASACTRAQVMAVLVSLGPEHNCSCRCVLCCGLILAISISRSASGGKLHCDRGVMVWAPVLSCVAQRPALPLPDQATSCCART